MLKRVLAATAAIFLVWQALDFVIHGIILRNVYASMPNMWRPMAEIKMPVMWIVGAIAAFCFAAVYGWLVRPKNVGVALRYGLLFGLGAGVSMGYGTYAVMPVPYSMALTWFLGTFVEALAAGALVGVIVREPEG